MPFAVTTRRIALVLSAALAFAVANPHARAVALAHWTFDTTVGERNVYPDTVGNGHPALPADVAQVKPFTLGDAPFGRAVMFSTENGQKNSFLTTPPIGNFQKSSFTITAWVYFTKNHANFIITDWKLPTEAAWVFGVDLPAARAPKTTPIADLRSADVITGGPPNQRGQHIIIVRLSEPKKDVPLNEWHHMAWSWNRNPGVLTSYLDGEVIGTGPQAHTPLDLTPAKNAVRIGGREDRNINMDGALDELWIFNDVLTDSQVRNMMRYNNTGGTGGLSKVLVKKPDGTFALANPAAPVVEPPRQVAANPRPPRQGPMAAARDMPPAPATPAPTETPPTAAAATPPADITNSTPIASANTTPEPAPITTVEEETPPAPAVVRSIGVEVIASNRPLAVTPRRFTPGRLAGVVSCAILSLVLSAYLFWAFNERSKMKMRS